MIIPVDWNISMDSTIENEQEILHLQFLFHRNIDIFLHSVINILSDKHSCIIKRKIKRFTLIVIQYLKEKFNKLSYLTYFQI